MSLTVLLSESYGDQVPGPELGGLDGDLHLGGRPRLGRELDLAPDLAAPGVVVHLQLLGDPDRSPPALGPDGDVDFWRHAPGAFFATTRWSGALFPFRT